MRDELFRGVIRPRDQLDTGQYRYAIVGVLVTDQPIPEWEPPRDRRGRKRRRKGQPMACGPCHGLADVLAGIPQARVAMIGDANSVLTGPPILLAEK